MKGNEVQITNRDRLLRAWESSMDMVRDFQNFSEECKTNPQISSIFSEFAEHEGEHAATFRQMLLEQQQSKNEYLL